MAIVGRACNVSGVVGIRRSDDDFTNIFNSTNPSYYNIEFNITYVYYCVLSKNGYSMTLKHAAESNA